MSQKNVNKFLAGAVTATMVATAVVTPAMAASFTDTGKLPEKIKGEVERAVELGYFQDSEKFNPAASITRGQVALVIARQVSGVAANDIAGLKAYVAKHGLEEKVTPFADVKKGETELYYASLIVKNAGAFTQDSLNPASNITRSQMAKVVVTAFDLKMNEDNKKEMTDISKVSNKEYIEILASNGVTEPQNGKFNPGNNVTRSQMASFLVRAHDGVEDANVNIVSAKAINAKTIEVKFNKAVDTDKAKVELLRGTFAQNATTKWAEDKKSLTLEVPGLLQTSEYTVNVKGLSEKVLTSSVKVEAQKVQSIEILDDLAVLSQDNKKATVTFVVKDQYGEDITKNNKFKIDVGNSDTQKVEGNTVTILGNKEGTAELKADTKVAVVLIHKDNGTTATKTVTISKASAVTDIAVKGIFDKNGKQVTLNEDVTEKQYIVLDLKDQYGKKVTDKTTVEKMLVTNTNDQVLALREKPTVVPINGKDEAVIEINKVLKAGTAKAIVISSSNGKTADYDITVAETTRTDAVSLSQPEQAIEGEPILVPLTVFDKEGKQVVDEKILKDSVKGLKQISPSGAQLVVKDGKTFVEITGKESGDYVTVLVQSSTFKTDTVTFKVEDKAVPTIITGLKSPLVVKGERTVTAADLIVKDQYNREVKADKVGEFTISQVVSDSKILKVESKTIKGLSNGKDKVEIKLNGKDDSAIEVEVQVTDGKEYKSYEVKKLGLLNAKEANKVTVSGILANGGKVELSATDYKASTNVTGVQVTDGKLVVDESKLDDIFKVDGKKVAEREVKVTYIINNDGSTVEQTYTISAAESKVQNFFFTSSEALVGAKEITELKLEKDAFTVADVNLVTTNQYGKKAVVTSVSALKGLQSVTIMPSDASKVAITDNGTANAKVTALADTTVTVKVKVDGVTKDLKVTLAKAN